MPALIHFGRKWLLACDDLVIPSIIEIILRIPWLIASIIVAWFNISGCNVDNLYITCLMYTVFAHHLLTVCICFATFIASSRGTILQAQKRMLLPKILYVRCATVLVDFGIISYGSWLLLQEWDLCFQWKGFIELSVGYAVVCVIVVFIGVSLSYNSLGSSAYWESSDKVNSEQLFKKAEYVWRLRLKFFCCCADVNEEESDCIYSEISSFLATFLNDIDLTPTDILAGLITVSKKHSIEKRKFKWPYHPDPMLDETLAPSWMTVENALHYLRIAKSTYGWAAFFDPLYPCNLCTLFSPSRCCLSLFQLQNSIEHGDCCYCNSSAVKRITGLPDSDILYASFANSVYEPAFIITFDHSRKVVIIAIRGTRSFSDLITDIDLDEMSFPSDLTSNKFTCHRGALRSALFIHKKINELQVLKTAFHENPSYTLVLTGHSLGGSIAAILGMLLHSEYPSLQCYSYAPLPVLSAEALPKTFDFVFSVVVGDDIVPRFSMYSFKELMKQIYSSLEETQFPKYKLLSSAFWRYITKSVKSSKKKIETVEVYENKQIDIKDELAMKEIQPDTMPKEAHLYAPGRILYFESPEKSSHSWVTGFYFQKIFISSSVIKHHQPHQIQVELEKYKSANENAASTPVQQPSNIKNV